MVHKLFIGVLGCVIGATCMSGVNAQSGRRYINGRSAANPANATQPPFSGAVVVGDTAYLSGVLGAGDTAEAAATAGLTSLRNSLTAAGMTMDDLVSIQIFCPDIANYDSFNKVYRTFFTQEFPARAFSGFRSAAQRREVRNHGHGSQTLASGDDDIAAQPRLACRRGQSKSGWRQGKRSRGLLR